MSFLRYFFVSFLFFSTASIAAESNADENWTPRDEDLRLLEMRVENYKLEDVLPAYQRKDYLLIPLGYLSEILDLAIDADIGSKTAKGFVFNESNTFFLDISRNQVVIKGITTTYKTELVYVLDDDIYVDAELLSTWFEVSINADLFSSSITIKSDYPFPFIERLKREEKIAKTKAQLNTNPIYLPRHYEPYDMWNLPFVDQTFEATSRNSSSNNTTTLRSTTYMTADLLSMESSAYIFATNDDVLDDFRFTIGKKDPESDLLNIAKASEYSMGHISEPRLKNITLPGNQQVGALISNFPLDQQAEYDEHRFRGNLLPGWEVELYQNDRLIGYQSTAVDGQYDFNNVPLLFGRNYFRLVFYGPQGQVREQEQQFELSQALTKKGKHYYRALVSDNEEGGNRATAQYDIGLSKQISASFVGASIPLLRTTTITEQHNYLQAGLRGYWENYFVTLDVIDDLDSGEAVNFDLQTGIGDATTIKFNHTIMNQFFSEEYILSGQEFKDNTELRLDTTIPPSFLPRIPFSLEINLEDYESGNDRKEIINRLSLQTYGLSLSNQLSHVKSSDFGNQFTGIFGLSSYVKGNSLRGTINYAFEPESELTSIDMSMRPPLYNNYQFTYGLNHSLSNDVTEISASASKPVGKYNLSFGARYNTDEVISLDARFSIGIGREPRQDKWSSQALAIAGRGSVSARVFLDNNQDGIFNEGDEAIKNVGFTINGGYQKVRTDENGIAFITGLPEHRVVNLVIAKSTLDDPLWNSAISGMQIVPRPGQAMQLDFPIFNSGEIDGTIYLVKDGRTIPAGRVKLEVIDSNDNIVNTGSTEYDGFYVISNVPLGSYRVRVSPEQMSKLSLTSESLPEFTITSKNQFKSGLDFILTKTE